MFRSRLFSVGRTFSSRAPSDPEKARAVSANVLGKITPSEVVVPKNSVMHMYPTPCEPQVSAWNGIVSAVSEARSAVSVASSEDSDDVERNQSVALARNAIRRFDAKRASLSAKGESGGAELERFEAEVGEDVKKLKNELFLSRKPRVWMAYRDWF